ncbi:MAG: hypothetical protein ACKOA9_06375 [Actinomycetota bacterium]
MGPRSTRRILVVAAFVAAWFGVLSTAVPAFGLPPIGQPGEMRDPRNPANQSSVTNPVAVRNFGDGTPCEAITGGVFDNYGIPGFFPYGTGAPGSGTGGWVSGIAHG